MEENEPNKKVECAYCGLEFNPQTTEAKEVNKNYDQPIFCDYGCERDYEIELCSLEQSEE